MMTRYWRSLTSSPRWILVVIVFVILLILCSWIWKAQLISDVGPTWRRITVGQSTVNDVIAILGEPSSVESGWGQIVYVYQEGRFEWGLIPSQTPMSSGQGIPGLTHLEGSQYLNTLVLLWKIDCWLVGR